MDSLNLTPIVNYVGTCDQEWQLFKTGTGIYGEGITPHEYNREFPIKGEHVGDIIIAQDTKNTYIWTGDNLDLICTDNTTAPTNTIDYRIMDKAAIRKKKTIPHPTSCEKCGSLLHGYTCEACGAEYPSFEYIIEEGY